MKDNNHKKFFSLLSDTTFKYLFKKEENKPFFRKTILDVTGIDINGYTLINNEINSGNNKKDYWLDILLKKDDSIINIEMNQFISRNYYNPTSLKNRNYYNEKVNLWNKNTIYPQACIVLDINELKTLNDTLGHEEGDKLIQKVANALIKTQIDNSEIMRTDGNEFFVYLVGYPEKQVLSYIKKLIKEFKKLDYEPGVAMGFSMIEDDSKLVEDAFNEASIKMRDNKEESYEKKN